MLQVGIWTLAATFINNGLSYPEARANGTAAAGYDKSPKVTYG